MAANKPHHPPLHLLQFCINIVFSISLGIMRNWEQRLPHFFLHLSLPKVNINIYFSLWEKCDLGEGLIHCCNDWEQSESGIQALRKLKGMLFFVITCLDGIKMSWGLIQWRVCIAHADFIWEQEVVCITKTRTGFGLQLQWAYIYVIYFNLCSYKFRGNILKHEMEGNKSKKKLS